MPGPNPISSTRSSRCTSSSETAQALRRRFEARYPMTQPATRPARPVGRPNSARMRCISFCLNCTRCLPHRSRALSCRLKRTSSQGEPVPDNDATLPIGALARRTGSATSALRYYERIDLLPRAERAGGRRHYPPASAERIALIRLYQDAGFTLAEIRQLLAEGGRRRRSWRRLAERKIDELDARIAEAQHARELLEHALGCPHRNLLSCPNFRAALQAHLAPDSASGREHESRTGARTSSRSTPR